MVLKKDCLNIAVQRNQWLSFVVTLFVSWRKQFALYPVENLY